MEDNIRNRPKTLALFTDEMANFFSIANIGLAINGRFDLRNGKEILDNTSLVPSQIPLNDCLFFTKPQNNPLYGILSAASMTPLFVLHAYYSNMQYPQDATRLSASNEMRMYLRETLIETIKYRAQQTIQNIITQTQPTYQIMNLQTGQPQNVNNINAIDYVLNIIPTLIQSIDNPSIVNRRITVGENELFNPNYFVSADFPTVIIVARVKILTREDLRLLQEQTYQVYKDIIPFNYDVDFGVLFNQTENNDYVQVVLKYQLNMIALARSYKNKQRVIEQRRRRALRI
jgi:hypothetical protein